MKALVAYGRGDYRFEPEYPTPECGPDDIIIKVEGCGVCAGDLKCQHGVAMFWGDEMQPSWVKPPFIPGHEFFGRVVQLGENVTEYELGDRITADQIVPCGKCRFCTDITGCASRMICTATSTTTMVVWLSTYVMSRTASSLAYRKR